MRKQKRKKWIIRTEIMLLLSYYRDFLTIKSDGPGREPVPPRPTRESETLPTSHDHTTARLSATRRYIVIIVDIIVCS